jgi:hypothetical protein
MVQGVYKKVKGGEANEMDVPSCHSLFRVWSNMAVLSMTLNRSSGKGRKTHFRPFLVSCEFHISFTKLSTPKTFFVVLVSFSIPLNRNESISL